MRRGLRFVGLVMLRKYGASAEEELGCSGGERGHRDWADDVFAEW